MISDVVTKWGSTYEMLARILEQQHCAVLAEDIKKMHHMASDQFTVLPLQVLSFSAIMKTSIVN